MIKSLSVFFLFVFGISFGAYSQDGAPEEVIQKVRDHYYGVNNNLPDYVKRTLNDSVTVYLKNMKPYKTVLEKKDGTVFEFYFEGERAILLFVYEVKGSAQNRYYFGIGETERQFEVNMMYRWVDENKNYISPKDELFKKKDLQIQELALDTYAFVEERLTYENKISSRIYSLISNINGQVEAIEKLSLEEEKIEPKQEEYLADADAADEDDVYLDPSPCDKTTYRYTDKGQLVKEFLDEHCDSGCGPIENSETTHYYNAQGELIYEIYSSSSSGGTPEAHKTVTYFSEGKAIYKQSFQWLFGYPDIKKNTFPIVD